MSKYNIFGRFSVQEGKQGTIVEILLEAAESMKALSGCELYIVSTNASEPNHVYVYEVWENEQAHQASLTLDVTQTLIQQARPIITGMERLNTLQALGGKGLN